MAESYVDPAGAELVSTAVEICNPEFADAELTGGACEYLLGSMPFFVRWFVRFDGVEGENQRQLVKAGTSCQVRAVSWILRAYPACDRQFARKAA